MKKTAYPSFVRDFLVPRPALVTGPGNPRYVAQAAPESSMSLADVLDALIVRLVVAVGTAAGRTMQFLIYVQFIAIAGLAAWGLLHALGWSLDALFGGKS